MTTPSGPNVERGFGETVLVVDDEPTVRMLIAEVLSESGYEYCRGGATAPSAAEDARKRPPRSTS